MCRSRARRLTPLGPVLWAASLLAAPHAAGDTPNVVLILADDMGLASMSAMHPQSGLATPALDRLAAQGMAFTDAHSGSGVCSPTRYGLLTGRYAWRTRMKSGIVGKWQAPLIADERLTIAEMVRERGYRTDCVGKWHLGWLWPKAESGFTRKPAEIDYGRAIDGGPLAHGFDSYLGDDVPNWPPYIWIEGDRALAAPTGQMKADPANGVSPGPMTPGWSLEAVLPELTARCARTIAARAKEKEPFFLFFSMTSPHTPINPAEAFRGKTGKGKYADFLVETDWAVGEVLRALDEAGVADETLVIFTSDNGTSPKCDFEHLASNDVDLRGPWRGHKADIWEGGHRVPFVVRWPGVVRAGARCDEPVVLTDVMATVAAAVGAELPPGAAEDSTSLVPWLKGEDGEHPPVVHHSSNGQFALRDGRWKLAFCPGSGGWSAPKGKAAREAGLPARQLYDMQRDPGERENLATKEPERVLLMTEQLRRIVTSGRSTPGPEVSLTGRAWWSQLPWAKPE